MERIMTNRKALLIDTTRCIGCNACQDACQEENKLPELPEENKGILSDKAYTALVKYEGKSKDGEDIFVRQLCRHCNEPACLSVCLVNAFYKTPEGAVLYDGQKCIGCRNCMQACPFYVPKYEWKSNKYERGDEKHEWKGTFPRVKKCVLCSSRISNGQQTACAEACESTGMEATVFGDFDDMVAEANKRIGEEPDKYVPRIYGLKEVGGTTVLYLSSVPFEEIGFDTKLQVESMPHGFDPKLTERAMPPLTMKALSKVPNVVGIGAVLLGGIWWITNRRHEVQENETAHHDDSNSQN
jgi:formate dehydrogenase iron-sulfur subunit